MALDHKAKAIVAQIDEIFGKTDLRSPHRYNDVSDLPVNEITAAVSLLFAAIERLAPPGSSYVRNAKRYEECLAGNIGVALGPLRGILQAIKADYQAGYLQSVVELVHADVFADFRNFNDTVQV